ncbi:hypothetical protein NEOKW01_1897 [Nematocida sp. AWRm80]|nr:hypothetical protein NEOKW01_1317 [Nematocida sp. AWRm80]KAI5181429.1 hypothetical protein NEOKW01_1610 [Nematocida sp. AWRm80]KAI5181733.1 hypothetical protein NEOKW01_1897 [Nematocida sp. AWRm80]
MEILKYVNYTETTDDNVSIITNATFGIEKNKLTALIGLSGGGKSTLMKSIALQSAKGHIKYGKILTEQNNQLLPRNDKGWYMRVLYISHSQVDFKNMRVKELLYFYADMYNEKHEEVDCLIKSLKLSRCSNSMYTRLSKDEKKRVAIITGLLAKTEIRLWDKVVSIMDAEVIDVVLKRMILRSGTNIISMDQISTKILGMVDNVLFMHQGTVVYSGPVHMMVPYFEYKNIRLAGLAISPMVYLLQLCHQNIMDEKDKDNIERLSQVTEQILNQHRGLLLLSPEKKCPPFRLRLMAPFQLAWYFLQMPGSTGVIATIVSYTVYIALVVLAGAGICSGTAFIEELLQLYWNNREMLAEEEACKMITDSWHWSLVSQFGIELMGYNTFGALFAIAGTVMVHALAIIAYVIVVGLQTRSCWSYPSSQESARLYIRHRMASVEECMCALFVELFFGRFLHCFVLCAGMAEFSLHRMPTFREISKEYGFTRWHPYIYITYTAVFITTISAIIEQMRLNAAGKRAVCIATLLLAAVCGTGFSMVVNNSYLLTIFQQYIYKRELDGHMVLDPVLRRVECVPVWAKTIMCIAKYSTPLACMAEHFQKYMVYCGILPVKIERPDTLYPQPYVNITYATTDIIDKTITYTNPPLLLDCMFTLVKYMLPSAGLFVVACACTYWSLIPDLR